MARKKKDKDKTGKLVDEVDDKDGPSSRNNRLRKFVRSLRER